jgi:hypothetical protein
MHIDCPHCQEADNCRGSEKARAIAVYLTLPIECRMSMPVIIRTINQCIIIIGIEPVCEREIPRLKIPNAYKIKTDWSVEPVYTQTWLKETDPSKVSIIRELIF